MLCFVIEDDGIGAYRKLMQDFEFDSAAHAIQALQAGKLTSDPTNHAGEGIFFSSKMAAEFALESAGKRWKVNAVEETAAIEASLVTTGTRVSFTIDPRGTEPSGVVFDRYTTGEDNDHTRTRIVVHLYEFGGEELRARSAAKRLAASVEPYAEAVLDFKGVEELGQGFADQLFVVFAREHPETELIPINTNPSVDAMIRPSASDWCVRRRPRGNSA